MRLKSCLAGTAAGCALAFASAPANAANLVVNGGFETPVLTPGGVAVYNAGSASLSGWTVLGSDVVQIHRAYNEELLNFNANSGDASLDLTGLGNTGPANAVQQTIATGTGLYRLSFYVGNAAPGFTFAPVYGLASTINLSINGGPVQSFTNATDTPFGINWRRFELDFRAVGPTTLLFSNGTPFGDNFAGLDDVSVILLPPTGAIPEPASWAMMIAGFGAIGTAARRRRMAVTA